jgi:hypothetical protein
LNDDALVIFATATLGAISAVLLLAPASARQVERRLFPSESRRMDSEWATRPHLRFRVAGVVFLVLTTIGVLSLTMG